VSGSECPKQEFFEIQAALVEQIFLSTINLLHVSHVKPVLSFRLRNVGYLTVSIVIRLCNVVD
jgi:hypothetical protein